MKMRCHFSLIMSLQTNQYAYFRVSGHRDILFTMLIRLVLGNFRMYMQSWRKMQRWKTSLTLSSRILRVPHWRNTGYPSWRWSSFWHKISTHSVQATGLSSNPHSSSCFLGWKFMIMTSMVGIFLISLQCLITFPSNRLLSWKIMVCLHSQWQETLILVLPWTYSSSRQWIWALSWSLVGWPFWTMKSNSFQIPECE